MYVSAVHNGLDRPRNSSFNPSNRIREPDPIIPVVEHRVVGPQEDVPQDPQGAHWDVQAHEAADALGRALGLNLAETGRSGEVSG